MATGCFWFGKHQFEIVKRYDENIFKVRCSKCKKEFAVHLAKEKMVAWNEEIALVLGIYESNLKDAKGPYSRSASYKKEIEQPALFSKLF